MQASTAPVAPLRTSELRALLEHTEGSAIAHGWVEAMLAREASTHMALSQRRLQVVVALEDRAVLGAALCALPYTAGRYAHDVVETLTGDPDELDPDLIIPENSGAWAEVYAALESGGGAAALSGLGDVIVTVWAPSGEHPSSMLTHLVRRYSRDMNLWLLWADATRAEIVDQLTTPVRLALTADAAATGSGQTTLRLPAPHGLWLATRTETVHLRAIARPEDTPGVVAVVAAIGRTNVDDDALMAAARAVCR